MDELLIGLAAVLSFLFGWNNSSLLVGNLRGAGSLSYRSTIMISVAGLLLGVVLEGSKMVSTLGGSLVPAPTSAVLLSTVLVSVILVFVLTLLDLPVSFSMIIVAAFLGAAYTSALPVNVGRSVDVVGFWFAAPVVTAAIAFVVYRSVARSVSRFGILAVDSLNRAGAVVSALAVSYTLGANNIGLFYASVGASAVGQPVNLGLMLLLVIATVVGVITLGGNALGGTIGDKMLTLSPQGVFAAFISSALVVWAGTQLALPISITQCILGGMLGVAFSRVASAFNRRLVGDTLSLWVVAPLVAFTFAYILTPLL